MPSTARFRLYTALCLALLATSALGQAPEHTPCRIEATRFEGWQAEQLSNEWLRLTVVPQLGGRLMQVEFGGHAYLFVNPRYKGRYVPPSDPEARAGWINYGGDKIWPMPEGSQDEQHWPGPLSGPLDDGVYKLTVIAHKSTCKVRLIGPPDPQTGLQYTREIGISSDDPEISFHAEMRNTASHPIRWSVQSVTQYDLAAKSGTYNHQFWAFAPLNPHSAYLEGYHVRAGLADDPSFSIKNGMFILHWLDLQNEVWLDSAAGWIALWDAASGYAMVERFQYRGDAQYPGKATVIFYKNGPAVEINQAGVASLSSASPQRAPYYMEAEINSPVVELLPGETYAMDTEWYPARLCSELQAMTHPAAIAQPVSAVATLRGLMLSGAFGVFFPGQLVARLYDSRGLPTGNVRVQAVTPANFVSLHQEIAAPADTARVSLHLLNEAGGDEGILGEAQVARGNNIR